MQARGEFAQVLDPAPGVLDGLAEEFPGPIWSRLPPLLGKLKVDERSDQMLLGTVVQVPGKALTPSTSAGNSVPSARMAGISILRSRMVPCPVSR
jgi:hypothetical protein